MGKLVLVNLPIGNISDITLRSLEALKNASIVVAEDTRNFQKLCQHLNINLKEKKLESYFDHSAQNVLDKILSWLKDDKEVVYVSDAGSPIVSDPAFPLIQACLENDIEVDSFSGISAVICALELSGLPPHPFHFLGFFPRESKKQREWIEKSKSIEGTQVFFESPHRAEKTLQLLVEFFPDSDFVLARELTKKFQTVHRFEGRDFTHQRIKYSGEMVILLSHKNTQESKHSAELIDLANTCLNSRGKKKDMAKLLAYITGKTTKDIYKSLGETP